MKKKIYLLFFFSGVSALIYEIIWTRLLSLVFGNTTIAITITLSIFMGGLSLGSLIFAGKTIENFKPLNLYGLLEIGIGIFGFAFIFILEAIKNFYVYISTQTNLDFIIILQIITASLILIIPTILMGGTFPALFRYFELYDNDKIESNAGVLYSINTIGAVFGSILGGFFLISNLGVRNTIYFAGLINICVGIASLFWQKKIENKNFTIEIGKQKSYEKIEKSEIIWLIIFALSGFCGIGYEVVLTRLLVLIINSTVYAFSLILVVFLLGIASGSAVGTMLINRYKKAEFFLGFSEIFISFYTLSLIFYIHKLADVFFILSNVNEVFGNSWILFSIAQFVLIFFVLFPISFTLGITFPAIVNLTKCKSSFSIGRIYAWNTIGAIVGSLFVGFLLLQFYGIKNTVLVLVTINILIGIISFLKIKPVPIKILISAVSIFFILTVLAFPKDITFKELITRAKVNIIFHKEDAGQITEVYQFQNTGEKILATDRHQREGGTNSIFVYNQRQQGYLPLLIHPDPKKVLGLGLGTGISFSVVEKFDIEKAEVVEISEGVIKALEYFEPENSFIKDSKKIKIHKQDARNFVLLTNEKYDVITSDLFVPYQAGVGNLYAEEHYEACKNKLAPGGMLWQWIPIAQISGEDLFTVINTFQKVFPHSSLWLTNQSVALLGMREPLKIDFQKLKQTINNSAIKDELMNLDLADPYKFLSLFQLNTNTLKKLVHGYKINSDNYPYIEFNAPKYFYVYMTPKFFIENVNKILYLQNDILQYIINIQEEEKERLKNEAKIRVLSLQAQIYLFSNKKNMACNEYEKIYKLSKDNKEANKFLEDYYMSKGWYLYSYRQYKEAREFYKKILEINPNSSKVQYYLDALPKE